MDERLVEALADAVATARAVVLGKTYDPEVEADRRSTVDEVALWLADTLEARDDAFDVGEFLTRCGVERSRE